MLYFVNEIDQKVTTYIENGNKVVWQNGSVIGIYDQDGNRIAKTQYSVQEVSELLRDSSNNSITFYFR